MDLANDSAKLIEEIDSYLAGGDVDAALERLAERLKALREWQFYFDVRLIQHRRVLGLPVTVTSSLDDLQEPTRTRLEERYLETCREVGLGLLAEGKLREAWSFLRPLGDKSLMIEALQREPGTDQDVTPLIELALYEGLCPVRGYQLLLEHHGVCNAITAYESHLRSAPLEIRADAAALLVRRVHADLLGAVRSDVERRTGKPSLESSLVELIRAYPEVFADRNYHLDTSHLNGTVRIARELLEPEAIRMAWELTQYGERLDPQYQFAGEKPFENVYEAHAHLLGAMLGEHVDEALEYFRERAASTDAYYEGTLPAEIYILLLARCGKWREALDARSSLISGEIRAQGVAPSLWEICRELGDFQPLVDLARDHGDARGFLTGVLAARGVL